jgi:hypothetical protein
LSCLESLFVQIAFGLTEVFHDVLAVLVEGVLEALGHEDVAPEDAAEGRPLDLVDGVGEVVACLVLLDCQLQLADCRLDLDFEDHVLGLGFGETVVHLKHLISLDIADVIDNSDGLLQMIQRVEHDFGPQKVANLADCFDLVAFSISNNLGDLFSPPLHDCRNNDCESYFFFTSGCFGLLLQGNINTFNDGVHSLFGEFSFEHLLEDSQNDFVLLALVLGDFIPNPVKGAVGLLSDCVHQSLVIGIRLTRFFVDVYDFRIDFLVAVEVVAPEEVLLLARGVEMLHLHGSVFSLMVCFLLRLNRRGNL